MSVAKKNNGVRPLGCVRLSTKTSPKNINILGSSLTTNSERKQTAPSSKIDSDPLSKPELAFSPPVTEKLDKQIQRNEDGKLKKELGEIKDILREKDKLLTTKDLEIKSLKDSIACQEEYYRELYENEHSAHGDTKQLLRDTEERLTHIENQMSCLRVHHDEKLQALQEKTEREIEELRSIKDEELSDQRLKHKNLLSEQEEKISNLKRQMVDILKGNSWERQHQIEELMKELAKIQEEAEELRMMLRNKGNMCVKCALIQESLDETRRMMNEKEQTIKELNQMCLKFNQRLQKLGASVTRNSNQM